MRRPRSRRSLARPDRANRARARGRERRPDEPRPGRATRCRGGVSSRARPAGPRRPRQPRHPVHVPRALHRRPSTSSSATGRRPSRSTARPPCYVVGLNSVRAWRHQSGGIRERQLHPDGRALRAGRAGRAEGRRPPPPPDRRALALAEEAGLTALARPRRARRRRRRADPRRATSTRAPSASGTSSRSSTGDVRGATVSVAPGLGQPRPDRRGEARGLHVYECAEGSIRVETYIWREDDWGLTAVRRFARGREPLVVEPA